MKYEIKTDRHWTPIKKRKTPRERTYPFDIMKPGQYFVIDDGSKIKDVQNKINQAAMRAGAYYAIRTAYDVDDNMRQFLKVYHDGYRIKVDG